MLNELYGHQVEVWIENPQSIKAPVEIVRAKFVEANDKFLILKEKRRSLYIPVNKVIKFYSTIRTGRASNNYVLQLDDKKIILVPNDDIFDSDLDPSLSRRLQSKIMYIDSQLFTVSQVALDFLRNHNFKCRVNGRDIKFQNELNIFEKTFLGIGNI